MHDGRRYERLARPASGHGQRPEVRCLGMLGSAIDRALPFRMVERVRRKVVIEHGGRHLTVPLTPRTGGRVWADWQPDWKTGLLERLLPHREGAFIDVGANLGQSFMDYLLQPRANRYIGFEPSPECAAFLQSVIAVNSLTDCAVIQTGLTDAPGVFPLHVPDGDLASASLIQNLRPSRPLRTLYVACLRFDSVWSSLGNGDISLIKIDVEGSELAVISGMSAALEAYRPPILCEVLYADHAADMSAYAERVGALRQLLAELGYTPYRVVKAGRQIRGFLTVAEFPLKRWSPANGEECDYLFAADGTSSVTR
jgi:FkbM family methyltransferase